MHLIEMELYGFKSFAKRTRIRFSEDITAIVGPNGSGKSNIVDGIMWALGESSAKQLRGSKMEDVIFSGTDRHSGVNYAEVVLVFDNKDGFFDLPYEELSISRKYFRSGESQYTINKKRVRQKDIREIFLDTGIGKNGYSFIGQGQIDEILSTRPQDRRNAFEEAAGISKFKLRKDESQRNLLKTEEHIERIDDIYSELLSRTEEMEDRKERAVKLASLEKQNAQHTYALASKEAAESKRKKEDITKKYEEVEENHRRCESSFEEKTLALEALEETLESFTTKETALSDNILEMVRKKEQLTSGIRLKEERSARLNEEIEILEKALPHDEKEAENLRNLLDDVKRQLKEASVALDKKNSDVDALEISLNRLKAQAKERDMGEKSREAESKKLLEEKQQSESRTQVLAYLSKEKKERLNLLSNRKETFLGEKEEIEANIQKLLEKIKDAEEKNNALQKDYADANRKKETVISEIKKIEEKGASLKIEGESVVRERDYLVRLRDNHEGFQYAVKQFLKIYKQEGFSESVVGPVAEEFKIDEGYALAISTALGFSGQNIILKDDSYIQEVLSFLKKKGIGRITFLPINALSMREIESGLEKRTKIPFVVASSCVSCRDFIRPVAEHLLGRILLVENAEDGKRLSKDVSHRYRIVTKDGEVFQTGGAVTGGQAKNHALDLYNRDADIEKKNMALKEIDAIIAQCVKDHEQLAASFKNLEERYVNLEGDCSRSEESVSRLKENHRHLIEANHHLKEQIDALDDEIAREAASLKQDEEELGEQNERIKELTHALDALAPMDDKDIEKLHEAVEKARESLSDERLVREKYSANVRELTIKKEQLEKNFKESSVLLEKSKLNLRELYEELSKVEGEIKKEKPEVEKITICEEDLDSEIKALRANYDDKRRALKDLKETVEGARQDVFDLEKEMVRLKNRLEDAQEIFENVSLALNNMEEPEAWADLAQLSITALRQKNKAIEEEMAQIGPVDGDTMEQYRAWSERVSFLSEQREDLLLSKDKLEKMIKNLDRQMRKQLDGALRLINGYFNEIFSELFQGGQASLAWDEGDILEAGILISARPPGKKLQSLSLLSGGERSMTAVALLFALLKMRQSPFCIVDEIDAALDDANIRRYSDYVKRIDDMQFIMITHRKQTMEMANEIYGVTMEEKGISRILFLELEEVETHVGLDKKEIQ